MNIFYNEDQRKLRAKLVPGTKEHDDIVKLVNEKFDESAKVVSQRYDAWRKAENTHLAYVDYSEKDEENKKLYPFARSIVVPYTYAILQTRLTYFFLAMFAKNPLVPMSGTGPMDVMPAKVMEVINNYQLGETSGTTVGYNWMQDAERYGVGIIKNVYHEVNENRLVKKKAPIVFMGITLKEIEKWVTERVTTYSGNIPINISPYSFFPDPNFPVSQMKLSSYCGHKIPRTYNWLLNREKDQEYFNIKYLDKAPKNTEEDGKSGIESNLPKIIGVETTATDNPDSHSLYELWINLIPKKYGLSKEEYPQDWLITVADKNIVVKCEPSQYREKPFYVIEPNTDHSSTFNLGTVELIKGLNDTLSWLFNSHMDNVRKVINDVLIIDPSMIDARDLLSGSPGKIVRMKEDFWGMGRIGDSYQQLKVSDITRSHFTDSKVIIDLIQRVTAATDNIMGMTEEVKRTATETSSTINLATSRLKLIARLYATNGLVPFYKAMTFNNQSFLDESRYYKITDEMVSELGQQADLIKNRLLVKSPDDIYGNFDFGYPNIDLSIDKVGMARVWSEIFGQVAQNQLLQQKFDLVQIFSHMIFNLGITNISDFKIKANVLPDDAVEEERRKGNLVPVNEVASANGLDATILQKMKEAFNAELGSSSNIPNVGERMEQGGV
jgi:hypothetical protein